MQKLPFLKSCLISCEGERDTLHAMASEFLKEGRDEEGVEFFKVVLKDASDMDYISLPKKFVALFGSQLPWNLDITCYTGFKFPVLYDDERGLMTGVRGFAAYDRLCFGDMLFFSYHGDGNFRVRVFSKSGLQKDLPLHYRFEEIPPNEERLEFKIKVFKSYTLTYNPGVYIKREYARATDKLRYGSVIICHKDGRTWPLKVSRSDNEVKITSKGWVKFVREVGAHVGQVLVFSEIAPTMHYEVQVMSSYSVVTLS